MAKVYIVSSTNFRTGYEQNEILTVFSKEKKARDFFEKEKERVRDESMEYAREFEVIDNKPNYYLIGTSGQEYWYEIILIEKELN